MDAGAMIVAGARAIASLAPTVSGLEACPTELQDVRQAGERGYFTPAEDERIRAWFARYLTARDGLSETIDDLTPIATGKAVDIDEQTQLRCFAVGYTAACVLVRAALFLVGTFATDKLVQRKLNEAEPRFGIPRKQYTAIFRSLTRPANAWRLHDALQFADANRRALEALAHDPQLAVVLEHLHGAEDALRVGIGRYVKARLRYRWHAIRRKRASACQQVMFAIAEAFGRVIADVRAPWHAGRVTDDIRRRIAEVLQPGDVIITRHDDALSNLFLPGYWPHASLHLGPDSVRGRLGISVSSDRAGRWVEPMRVLEARKDGVLLRTLEDTLTVDSVAVIRPTLTPAQIAQGLSRALDHEGKLYDFDFDFFRADRLVCTEVVYRALDRVGPLRFQLTRRAGRLTLSAEDLLDMAVDDRGFEPVAVYGAENCRDVLVTGDESRPVLAASYRLSQPE